MTHPNNSIRQDRASIHRDDRHHANRMNLRTQTWMERKAQSVFCASSLIGTEIRNPDGEVIGRISDIMIDAGSNRIAYVVFSAGGLTGSDEKQYVLPWTTLTIGTGGACLLLDIDKDWLKYLPIARRNVPTRNNPPS